MSGRQVNPCKANGECQRFFGYSSRYPEGTEEKPFSNPDLELKPDGTVDLYELCQCCWSTVTVGSVKPGESVYFRHPFEEGMYEATYEALVTSATEA